ncbi:hypothetical protein K501DRAFT_287997 [Backusella circina FSU 941]|nr:hypothetical protein K501DRAFT_287997 [Backusella circina FSU 941]
MTEQQSRDKINLTNDRKIGGKHNIQDERKNVNRRNVHQVRKPPASLRVQKEVAVVINKNDEGEK